MEAGRRGDVIVARAPGGTEAEAEAEREIGNGTAALGPISTPPTATYPATHSNALVVNHHKHHAPEPARPPATDAEHAGPMTDLLQVLPDLDTKPFAHLLPSLDRALITTNDLVTLDAAAVAKRAQLPAGELRKLADAVVAALHHQLGFGPEEPARPPQRDWAWTSTLDDELDAALGGGIPRGYLVEVTGERCVLSARYPGFPVRLS